MRRILLAMLLGAGVVAGYGSALHSLAGHSGGWQGWHHGSHCDRAGDAPSSEAGGG
jgi:hypothetical protein